jgi:hypothetical protein
MLQYDSAGRYRVFTPILVMAISVLCLQEPALAQDLHLRRIGQSTAGGHLEDGRFSVFSSVGTAAPSGTMQDEIYTLRSGGRALMSAPVPILEFSHVPAAFADLGSGHIVSGSIQEQNALREATLYYRRGGGESFSTVEMEASESGELHASIPEDDVTREGIVYYMELTDHADRTVRRPVVGEFGVPVRADSPGLTSTEPLPGGEDQSDYRLVSVPLILESPAPEEVLGDDLGSYEPSRWRFFELVFDQTVREAPDTQPFRPGRAFWLTTRDAQQAFDTGSGTTVDPLETYSIPLHPQWNLVANPFAFPLSAGRVSLRSGAPLVLRSFEGTWNDPLNAGVTELEPFSGYAAFNPSEILDTLDFEPRVAQAPSKVAISPAVQAAHALEWWVDVEARSGGSRDAGNIAGVSHDASAGLDALDHPEPPAVGSAVSVYFAHPEWQSLTSAFSTDIRPASLSGGSWDIHVVSRTGRAVQLTFSGVESVPEDVAVWLVDELTNSTVDLRENPAYAVSDVGSGGPRALRLVMGPASIVSDEVAEIGVTPNAVELSPIFPNPVRTSMSIRYGLPEPGRVTLRLYDALGRLVHEIANRVETEGFHVFVWESSAATRRLANGVYYVELQTVGARRVRTVTIAQ